MAHPLDVILAAVVTALSAQDPLTLAYATEAEERVFPSRYRPIGRREDMPLILVYAGDEKIDGDSAETAPRKLARDFPIIVRGVVAGSDGPDVEAKMGDIALSIEAVMHADPEFGYLLADSILDTVTRTVEDAGEGLTGVVELSYAATYYTPAVTIDPDTIDDFLSADVTINAGGTVHEDEVVQDIFEVNP